MIIVTRLGGRALAVNPDLIERAEATPDTVITTVDGHRYIVTEPLDEVVARVLAWRAAVAASAFTRSGGAVGVPAGASSGGPGLATVLPLPVREG